jgi:hypothetical protein
MHLNAITVQFRSDTLAGYGLNFNFGRNLLLTLANPFGFAFAAELFLHGGP